MALRVVAALAEILRNLDGRSGCLGHQLALTAALEGNEPPHGGIDGPAGRNDPVILVDERLARTEGLGHRGADCRVEHDGTGPCIAQRDVVVEHRRVLADHLERLAQRRERLAVHRVRMCGRDDVRPGGVQLRVNRECCRVYGLVAFDDRAVMVDTDEIRHGHQLEVEPEWIHPEPIGILGITDRDMAGHPFGEPEASHDPQTCCESLLPVETLGLEVELRFGTLERDALLVGFERAEIGFLGVGHGVRLRVGVVPERVIRPEKRADVSDPGLIHCEPRPLASLFALEDACFHQLRQVMADGRLRSADERR